MLRFKREGTAASSLLFSMEDNSLKKKLGTKEKLNRPISGFYQNTSQ